MFPDRASLYVVAIEDRQYKDYKIHCEYSREHASVVTRLGLCPHPDLGMGTLLALALRKRKVGIIHLCGGDTNEFEPILG